MLQWLYLLLRNLAYKNRLNLKPGNRLEVPLSVQRRLKKVTIKLGGRNNRLLVGEGTELSHCEIRLDGQDNLIDIGPRVRFRSGKIYLRNTSGQHIRIGAETTVEGAYLLVDEAASIDIGRDCMLSTEILIRTGDKHSILAAHSGERLNPARDVHIADRVWIGRDVQILKGTVLHPESVVGACSVVSRAFEEGNCVVAGVPARIVKRSIRWDRALL
ncbi:acyltransferase [Pseudomonas taeanensis]|jgi:acetyltransferase-like isoleucine patch superfamily enzyme|uniref:acyltransferase n=1 Tax=Pseudomonas taeanensis TaxID=574962 RepID=UPI00046965F3|nr:acyltransferase [Pseudomonas taeanensis]